MMNGKRLSAAPEGVSGSLRNVKVYDASVGYAPRPQHRPPATVEPQAGLWLLAARTGNAMNQHNQNQKRQLKSKARKIRLPSVSSIVARSYPDHIIGNENELPWKLRTDLQHFKKTTNGKAIIMGRKTFESIGKPLPNRYNIVLSRSQGEDMHNLIWARDMESALYFADFFSIARGNKEFFVIGGAQMYSIFERFINKIYLTEVFSSMVVGDAKFDFDFSKENWKIIREEEYPATNHDQYPFRISVKYKKKQFVRDEMAEKFLSPTGDSLLWRERAEATSGIAADRKFEHSAEQFLLDV